MKRKQKIVAIAAVLSLAVYCGVNSVSLAQTDTGIRIYNGQVYSPAQWQAFMNRAHEAALQNQRQQQQQAQQTQQPQQQTAFQAAQTANDQGVAAYNNGDWADAINDFTQALQSTPNDPFILQNLANARQKLRQAQQQAAQELANQQAAAAQAAATAQAAASIEQNINNLAAEFNTSSTSTSTGMGFDLPGLGGNPGGGLGWTPPGSNSVQPSSGTALSFNDPNIVDATNAPPGLPKSVSDAITAACAKSPPDVTGWVRKGFEDVMNHDWAAAKACFQQAQLEDPKSDPENQGIGRLVGLADFTMAHEGINPAARPLDPTDIILAPMAHEGINLTAAPYSGLGQIPSANSGSAAQPAPAPLPSLTFSGPPGLADSPSAPAPLGSVTKKPGIDHIYVPVPTPAPRSLTQKFFDLLQPGPEPERPVIASGVRG